LLQSRRSRPSRALRNRTHCGPTDEKPYREWDEPAALINARANVTLMSDDDVDELARERWDQRLRDHRDA
jgi:hypothetical protein